MKIDNLTLMNFRNYESLNISFGDLNIIYGLNIIMFEFLFRISLLPNKISNDSVILFFSM